MTRHSLKSLLRKRKAILFFTVAVTVWINLQQKLVPKTEQHGDKVALEPEITTRAYYRTFLLSTNVTDLNKQVSATIHSFSHEPPKKINLPLISSTRTATPLLRFFHRAKASNNQNAIGGYLSQKAPIAGTGQGNLMFMYASMLGISNKANMTPVYPENALLRDIFKISSRSLTPIGSVSLYEAQACAFDQDLFAIFRPKSHNISVIGYLQSWKYFSSIPELVKREFTFKDYLITEVHGYLNDILRTRINVNEHPLFIGVHIRRKDMLNGFSVEQGYTVATKEYLVSAVDYFRTQFPSNLLIYVVCSDELDWAKQNFPTAVSNSSLTVFSENRTAAQDMALLSACNHSIITVGTFGWWSAYLIGGRTVYYKNFPAPETHIANIFVSKDYFPAEWIGL